MKPVKLTVYLLIVLVITLSGCKSSKKTVNSEVIQLGSKRELFVDDFLVERLSGKAELRLHNPTPQDIALETNKPWEGNLTNYVTVFNDGIKYRIYYRGAHNSYIDGKVISPHPTFLCYAESSDGIHWIRPDLGVYSWNGSKKNNIILDEIGAFAPFHDTNPKCSADAKYKALGWGKGRWGGGKHGLYAFKSADAIHWELMDSLPVITKGLFDSQNLAFWDSERGEYRGYHRDIRSRDEVTNKIPDADAELINARPDQGRDIRTETSNDFLNWTDPVFLDYSANVDPGNHNASPVTAKDTLGNEYPRGRVSELYTNQIIPYYRAPQLLIGFPARYIDRGWTESAKALPGYGYRQLLAKIIGRRVGTAVTETMIMSSRDRNHFMVWPEAFIRPGLRNRDTWFYGDMYQNWGIVETRSAIEDAPPELSFYLTERYRQETGAVLRRYSMRLDGFVSLHAPLVGGEMVTKPITFTGNTLFLNVSTSAAGSVRVEIQNSEGRPLPGFMLSDCHEIYGDNLNRAVGWKGNPDLTTLAGKTVRLRFVVRDADIYSFVFTDSNRY